MPHALLKDFKSQLAVIAANILGQLKAMAITYANVKANEIIAELRKECPPPEVFIKVTKTLDNLNSLMNKTDKQVLVMTKLPKKLDKAITVGKVIVELLSHLPIPSAVPPGVGIPIGIIQAQANFLVFARKMIENIENDQKAILTVVSSASGIFEPVKTKLGLIESLLTECASNPNLTQDERNSILRGAQGGSGGTGGQGTGQDGANSQDGANGQDGDGTNNGKGNTTDPSLAGTSYTSSNGTSYTLSVVIEENVTTIVPKRRAIAKDYRGIIVLQGPLSFASSEQVLLDELKFRIDNQLP